MSDMEALAARLKWYRPTDHPQDPVGIWAAHGIGGRYSIQAEDGYFLLWLAHDEFVWKRCQTVAEAKRLAEVDWQARYAALRSRATEETQ